MDRIVLMLQQVGAGFVGKEIGHEGDPMAACRVNNLNKRFLALLLLFSQGKVPGLLRKFGE
jgi:hypothetical protein